MKAILANPEEDLPRLMYADEIEGSEPARAEFIRVQCELAKTPETIERVEAGRVPAFAAEFVFPAGSALPLDTTVRYQITDGGEVTARWKEPNPRYAELRDREAELVGPANSRLGFWLALDPLPAVSGDWGVAWRVMEGDWTRSHIHVTVRRGFVEAVRCSGDDWEQHGDAILAAHPVRGVTLTSLPELPCGVTIPPYSRHSGRWSLLVAGKKVPIPRDRPWPYDSEADYVAGRTVRFHEAVLELRWPGVTFRYVGVERVRGAATDENGNWHIARRTEDGQIAVDVFRDPYTDA